MNTKRNMLAPAATLLAVAVCLCANSISTADCPFAWHSAAPGNGPNGPVYAMTTWDPDGSGPQSPRLVIGGSFTSVGRTPANRIAAWDGSDWQAFGTGMNSDVRALTVHDGDLYAGGPFTSAGGNACSRVAQWNGTNWQPLGAGLNEFVYALVSYGGELIVGGVFTHAGGAPANYIARWSAENGWQTLGSGMGGGSALPFVFALTIHDGSLIAAGQFQTAGGLTVNRIARWDGAWHPLGGGITSAGTPQVITVASHGADLYAGGFFSHAGGAPCNNIARWDGASWLPLSNGTNGPVYALTSYDDAMIATGEFFTAGGSPNLRIARTDGFTWSPLGTGINGTGRSLASFGGELIVGGLFTQVDSEPIPYWATWGPACPRGDLNCDHTVDLADLDPFVQALLDSPDLDTCPAFTADVNADHVVSGADIAAFLAAIL